SQKILEDAQKNNKYSQEQADRIKKEKSTEALNKIGGNALNSFTMQAKSISDQVLAGTLTEEQARASLIQLQAQYAGPITNLSTDNPQQANAWKSVFEDITKANLDIITNRGESGNRDIQ